MISIIFSTNNELKGGLLPTIFESIKQQVGEYEIIIVDNASTDGTPDWCAQFGQVITLPDSNRAQRMNRGVHAAKGDILLLHHSASILPIDALREIEHAVKNGATWWGFHHSFDHNHPLLRFTSWYSNYVRGKKSNILYLDHCIFVKKNIFEDIQWFPSVDIFEDTLLSYRLREISPMTLLPGIITTSARRFNKRGVWRQALLNQYLKILFHIGANKQKMNRLYEIKDGHNVRYDTTETRQ